MLERIRVAHVARVDVLLPVREVEEDLRGTRAVIRIDKRHLRERRIALRRRDGGGQGRPRTALFIAAAAALVLRKTPHSHLDALDGEWSVERKGVEEPRTEAEHVPAGMTGASREAAQQRGD